MILQTPLLITYHVFCSTSLFDRSTLPLSLEMSDPKVPPEIQRTVVNAAAGRPRKTEDVKDPVAGCANANVSLKRGFVKTFGLGAIYIKFIGTPN